MIQTGPRWSLCTKGELFCLWRTWGRLRCQNTLHYIPLPQISICGQRLHNYSVNWWSADNELGTTLKCGRPLPLEHPARLVWTVQQTAEQSAPRPPRPPVELKNQCTYARVALQAALQIARLATLCIEMWSFCRSRLVHISQLVVLCCTRQKKSKWALRPEVENLR